MNNFNQLLRRINALQDFFAFCFIFPPLAVLMCGKVFQAVLISPLLTICGVFPGILHAMYIVKKHDDDKRHKEMMRKSW